MKKIIGLLMMVLSATAYAQISKCVDKSGKVVAYGNQCPPGTTTEQTGIRNNPNASPAPAPEKSLAERNAEFRKRQIEKQEDATKEQKKEAQDAQQQQACNNARGYLKSLQAGNRIARIDPNTGERSFLQDADYPKEIEKAEAAVKANCK